MRQWYPRGRDEVFEDVYPDLPPEGRQRWVAVNMVTSVDGAVAVGGVSGPLGGDGDLAGFRVLRAAVDVVMAGAGTARAEQYGPPKVSPSARTQRRVRGQSEQPAVAVVSRSLDLTGADRLLEGNTTVFVLTVADAPPARREALRARGVTVLEAGRDTVDLADALDQLAALGMGRVLCEGGPSLNRALLAAGLVDELFVTVAPTVVGGDGPGIVSGALPGTIALSLREGRLHDGEVLLRYRVEGPDDRAARGGR